VVKENGRFYGHSLLLIVFSRCKSYSNDSKLITINALVKDIFGGFQQNFYHRTWYAINTLERAGILNKTIIITERKTVQYHYQLNPENQHVNV